MFELTRTPVSDYPDQPHRPSHGHPYQPVSEQPGELPVESLRDRKKNDDFVVTSESPPDGPTDAIRSPISQSSQPPSPTTQAFKYCSFCERQVLTTVELHPSVLSFLVAFFLFMAFGLISFCIIPFIWPLLQVAVHYCPLCRDVLDKKNRISCIRLKDEVITLRVGSCAVVLSRTYVVVCAVMLSLIMFVVSFRWYLNTYGLPDIPKGDAIPASWNDFLQDCGVRSLLGNPVKADKKFEDEYLDKTVFWEGARLHHIQEGIFGKHFMYLDMEPRQYQRSDLRDLALLFGKNLLEKVTKVDVGDILSIEASLRELGKRGRPHLGILWDFNVTTKAADLPPPEELTNRFILMQNRLGRPPIDLMNAFKALKLGQQGQQEQGDQTRTFHIILPFGDSGFPPIRVIKTTDSDENAEDEKEEEVHQIDELSSKIMTVKEEEETKDQNHP